MARYTRNRQVNLQGSLPRTPLPARPNKPSRQHESANSLGAKLEGELARRKSYHFRARQQHRVTSDLPASKAATRRL
jgi:hypothetical protein